MRAFFAIPLIFVALPSLAQSATPYRDPPAPIGRILDAAPTPSVSLSPTRQHLLIIGRAGLPPIAELAEEDLKLAGYRINPRNFGPANSRVAWLNRLTIKAIAGGQEKRVALPPGARFLAPSWSPDGRSIALLLDRPGGLQLWLVDVASARARPLTPATVNAVTGGGYSWNGDGSLLVMMRAAAGPMRRQPGAPSGPVVQENMGRTAPVRTFQDLLQNRDDEALFDHVFTARPTLVSLTGQARPLAPAGLYLDAVMSPDARYLLTEKIIRPYSYVVPAALFPTEIAVSDRNGGPVKMLARLPLRDDTPIQFDSVAKGMRNVSWRADAPATLVWAEAMDGGDAGKEAVKRDRVLMQAAPFTAPPVTLAELDQRFGGILWGRADHAIMLSRWWKNRSETRYAFDPSRPGSLRQLVRRNSQDRYNDPGMPLTRPDARGRALIQYSADGQRYYHRGDGASRAGEYPFIDRVDVASGATTRLWQSAKGRYESVLAMLDDSGTRLLTRAEGQREVPNFHIIDKGQRRALTAFADPAPELAGVTRKLLTYKRADGVELSGTLYLPAGYDRARDGPLPLVMWAYPTEFTDRAVAGQSVDTDNRFVRPGGISHLFLLTQGYAVLDNPTMPIVGEGQAEPNDTYVQQLVASAQAAADAVVAEGVADRNRLAIGGHSYGAFMTANLLAHSDIFRTGIARSGAYNRTLTPFGFQAEQRSYWEATDTYTQMSPFTHVRKINEPILLIHGAADDNSGTFPVQSERFYAALKGNGATARYVVLPLEAHGYRGAESVKHTQWEMVSWLDRYVKTAPPRR